MLRRKQLLTLISVLFFSTWIFAQRPLPNPVCQPSLSSKMICVVPQTYGPRGLILPNPNHLPHFTNSVTENFVPLSVSVGSELTLLSLASPASGVLFKFDPSLGVVTRSNESYGPILTERAETIGRHKIFLAGTYQYYNFSSLDGIDLKHIPVVLSHVQFQLPNGTTPTFEQDFITTDNRIDLKVHQVTLYATYGLTSNIDVSVAVPILDVRLAATSNAHIVRVQPEPVPPTDPNFGSSVNGFFHYFVPGDPLNSTSATFCNGAINTTCSSNTANGIGDVVFRAKGTVVKMEHARVALGLDVRTPTGDEKNFLGSGAVGVKPFIVASYFGRISPHVNLGFEWNGDSLLAGNVATGSTGKLPNQFFYSGGVDVGITRRVTVAADLLGQRLSSTERIRQTSFVDSLGATHPDIPQIQLFKDSANIDDFSVGAKFNPMGNLLITGNVLLKLNDPGLRARVVPLVGISYTF